MGAYFTVCKPRRNQESPRHHAKIKGDPRLWRRCGKDPRRRMSFGARKRFLKGGYSRRLTLISAKPNAYHQQES